MYDLTRRHFVKLTGGLAAAGLASSFVANPARAAEGKKRVVVVGGGYGGVIAAKYLRKVDPNIVVTLIEKEKLYYSCPLSNPIIVGLRDLKVQRWGYDNLAKHGINFIQDEVLEIDVAKRTVSTAKNASFSYDKLVVAPGVEFKWDAIEGYSEKVSEKIPHGWKAGPQTLLLQEQLSAMKDGDPYIIVAPPNPYRCPPGPYERAGLVAWYLKKNKPRSKVIILDPKDKFAKQGLFINGWKELGFNIEWVSGNDGGKVTRVDANNMSVHTEMQEYKSSAINLIPPQKAGKIAQISGLADKTGWCPVNQKTFESTIHKDVYVIGDACTVTGEIPKSGFAANSEAKIAAAAIHASFNGQGEPDPSYVNTCYSLLSPDYGISVAAVWAYRNNAITKVSGGVSPEKASAVFRKQEAMYAESWYQSIMAEMFS
ncbi:MAG: FCSD flavin-binding domain-containing protein [Magnetococcales bacterium]|nr:FCSD flavin-binding domain-containing protein [Magnetococcales bacterium]